MHHHAAAEARLAWNPLPGPEHGVEHILVARMRAADMVGKRLTVLAQFNPLPAPVGVDAVIRDSTAGPDRSPALRWRICRRAAAKG